MTNKDVVSNITASSASTNIAQGSQKKGQHKLSYADAVSSDFVKNAISQAIKEQRKVDARDATIVGYDFLEDNHDCNELLHMFDVLRCRCIITQHFRIGNDLATYRNKKTARRPIKLQLKSSGDIKFILANSKCLYDDPSYTDVNISKWLSQKEPNRV